MQELRWGQMPSKRQPVVLSWRNKLGRLAWRWVWLLLYRPSPIFLHTWRRMLLRLFGAKIGKPAYLYPSACIWAPWNLEMGDHSTLAHKVDCYSVDKVRIGSFTTVSQYSYLCTATHDYTDPGIMQRPQMPLGHPKGQSLSDKAVWPKNRCEEQYRGG